MPRQWVQIAGRQAIARSDERDGHVLGVFTDAYEPHQYTEYLLTAVGNILDDSLAISSAGVLRGGAVAWVEVSVGGAVGRHGARRAAGRQHLRAPPQPDHARPAGAEHAPGRSPGPTSGSTVTPGRCSRTWCG